MLRSKFSNILFFTIIGTFFERWYMRLVEKRKKCWQKFCVNKEKENGNSTNFKI
jgi:hypothetical protein